MRDTDNEEDDCDDEGAQHAHYVHLSRGRNDADAYDDNDQEEDDVEGPRDLNNRIAGGPNGAE